MGVEGVIEKWEREREREGARAWGKGKLGEREWGFAEEGLHMLITRKQTRKKRERKKSRRMRR